MAYVTTAERLGIEKGIKIGMKTGIETGMKTGIESGIQQGEARMLRSLLELKFAKVPNHYLQRIEEAPADILLQWAQRCINANCVEEVFEG
jgi:hypothetical protein